ncbi:WD40 repeat domain-containing protein [Streptomyces lichenis]|uniref:Sulfatase-modifying factor enzyme domain-containing protein n=1 Tax=Streptomyces lichenis TaxID=2306967 RepID=A0ABT0IEA3_9ACTN|nr:hypothetical protein [Streptomyces lichenis]MCK8679639.1 hypothetical protein [Streptomyces lichenis]
MTGKQTGPAHLLHAPGTSDTTLGEVKSAAFSPDGRLLAAAGRLAATDMKRSEANGTRVGDKPGRLGLWQVADGKRLADPLLFPDDGKDRETDIEGRAVTGPAYGPDGRSVVVSGPAGSLLWEVADPTQPREAAPPTSGASAAALSPDGTVPAGVDDRGFSLYATETGERLPSSFPYEIEDLRRETHIGGDGRRLIAGSSEAVPRRWDVSLWRAPLMDRLCERIGRPVTKAEWEAVAPPGIPYRELCD